MRGKQTERMRQEDGGTNVSRVGTDGYWSRGAGSKEREEDEERERGMSGKWQV